MNVPGVAAAGVVYLLKVKSRNWKRGTVDNSSAIYTDGWLGSRVVIIIIIIIIKGIYMVSV